MLSVFEIGYTRRCWTYDYCAFSNLILDDLCCNRTGDVCNKCLWNKLNRKRKLVNRYAR